MRRIVSSFEVNGITVNLLKPQQKTSIEEDKKRLAQYLYKLLEMGHNK